MIVIADSNLVYSALYTPNGVIANILKNEAKIQLIAPDFLIIEVKAHLEELIELNVLLENITIFKTIDIPKKCVLQAIEIVKDIDLDDAFFVAMHLFKKHKIWTTDGKLSKPLIKKGYNIFITTAEIKTKIYKKI